MQLFSYQFQPKPIPTLAALAGIAVMVTLGTWQSNKAQQKKELQDMYDARATQPAEQITQEIADAEFFRYKKVAVKGSFDARYQILLDNRVHNEQAGYHVITPFLIQESAKYVLVNRGWVPLGSNRAELPEVNIPTGMQQISGVAILPPSKIYELEPSEPIEGGWQTVWQNMDMERYRNAVPFQIQPIIIQLDQDSPGGFVREWPRPDTRIQTHLGYAFQWYGMAAMLAMFYIFTNLKKIPETE